MNQELIRRWNERVKEGDTVYHLGDIVFNKAERGYDYFADQLNGKIILIKGNHDDRADVRSILTSCTINYFGIDWYCQHQPEAKFSYNLCGHVHEKWRVKRIGSKVIVNVGVDQWDFYPITFEDVLRVIEETKRGEKYER